MKISSQSCTCSLSRLFLLNSLLYVQHVSAVSRACAYLPLELVISTSSRLARLAVAAEPRPTVMSQLAALKQASLVVDTDATDFLWPTSEKSIEACMGCVARSRWRAHCLPRFPLRAPCHPTQCCSRPFFPPRRPVVVTSHPFGGGQQAGGSVATQATRS